MREADGRRLAPGRVLEVDEPGRLPGLHLGAEIDMRLEEAAVGRVDIVVGAADAEDARLRRRLVRQLSPQHPEVVEEVKWRKPSKPAGVPVWSHDGQICTGETYKAAVKLTFANGASLEDPSSLFNSSLEGNTRRAIDIREGDELDEGALKELIRAAVAFNESKAA